MKTNQHFLIVAIEVEVLTLTMIHPRVRASRARISINGLMASCWGVVYRVSLCS